MKTPSLKTRAYIYRGILGTAPLVVAYGYVTANEATLWVGAIGAWLGVGLATVNSSTKEQ